jgi:hypothetical protein
MPSVRVMVKQKRGCGFRTPRGYYLCGGGLEVYCHRIPLRILVCEMCHRPLIHPIRGIQRIEPEWIWEQCPEWQDLTYPCHRTNCVLCFPPEKAYVIWVGESFYETPDHFLEEVRKMGISRKIHAIPEDLKIGDWVFLGYRKLIPTGERTKDGDVVMKPGIFSAFRVNSIEKLLTGAQMEDQYYIKSLLDRGITPVVEVDSEDEIEPAKERLYKSLDRYTGAGNTGEEQ